MVDTHHRTAKRAPGDDTRPNRDAARTHSHRRRRPTPADGLERIDDSTGVRHQVASLLHATRFMRGERHRACERGGASVAVVVVARGGLPCQRARTHTHTH